MIKVEDLYKSFGQQVILAGVSIHVMPGQIVAVLGPSGTGKTVLLKIIIGLLRPDRGKVFIDGEEISGLSEEQMLAKRKCLGYLFQEGALYDYLNIYENIAFPLREHTKMSSDEVKARVEEVLSMVDLQGVELKMPSELSGGMKKRVGLARAIVLKPKILLCDEPTSGLDPIRSRDISQLIRSVAKKINAATIFTSHDIENSFRIADKLVLLSEGSIVAQGTKEDLLSNQTPFVQDFVRP